MTPDAGQSKTYGAMHPTLTYGFTPALVSGDSFSGALTRDPGENVGLYNITQGTLALSANYTLTFTSGVQFEIKKLMVTVTPDAGQSKSYGARDPTLTYGFSRRSSAGTASGARSPGIGGTTSGSTTSRRAVWRLGQLHADLHHRRPVRDQEAGRSR